MFLCFARVVTPLLTRAMSRPPYLRPYGAQRRTWATSASESTDVPRLVRIYLELWLISRWRFPATPCFTLPVAVNLKRFFTPLFVLSLGILVSLQSRACEQPRQPLMAGRVPECSRKGGRLAEAVLQRNRFGTRKAASALEAHG